MELIAIIIALIVPIGVAIWTVRSSAKDTAMQIAALEESTTKQVESIKELAIIQTKIAALQLEKESWEARYRYLQTSKKNFNAMDDHFAMLGIPYNEITSRIQERKEKENNLSLEQDFYLKQISLLDSYNKRIKEILKELDKS